MTPDPPAAANVQIIEGDCLAVLPTLEAGSVQLCLSSPPYFALRSYLPAGHPDKDREIGSEPTPDAFVATMVAVFREVRRVLRDDGCLVINLGDSYSGSGKGPTGHNGIGDQGKRQGFNGRNAGFNERWGNAPGHRKQETASIQRQRSAIEGIPPKNLLMIPFRVAIALQQDGWILRSVIPWIKRSSMPESVTDRPSSAVEYLFLFSKKPRYFWDGEAIRQPHAEPGRTQIHYSKGYTPGDGEMRRLGVKVQRPTTESPGYHPAGRSFRNSDPFFQTWQGLLTDDDGDPLALIVNPAALNEAHFASFPAKLVEPFVRAGSSERGQCPACGAPWRRVVERTGEARQKFYSGANQHGSDNRRMMRNGQFHASTDTLGWQPSCSCPPADPVPQTVLDPFGGAGTVGLVANRLGRRAVLVELNPEYCDLARKRIEADAGTLFGPPATVTPARQPGLFEEAAG